MNMNFETNNDHYNYDTRNKGRLRDAKPVTEGGRKSLRNTTPKLINSLSEDLLNDLHSKNIKTVAYRFKQVEFHHTVIRSNVEIRIVAPTQLFFQNL